MASNKPALFFNAIPSPPVGRIPKLSGHQHPVSPLALPLSPSVHSAEVDSPTATHERLSCLDRGVWKAVAMPVGALPMLWDDSQESGKKPVISSFSQQQLM